MASPSKPPAAGSAPGASADSSRSSSGNKLLDHSLSLGNEKESSDRGLKPKARVASSQEEERCMILELPDGVESVIMSFQAHKDRLALAATCGDFWKAVEAFSKRKLEDFRLAHPNRDEDWEERIADQTSIETDMPKPLELPYRYLLWKAFRTHLYSLGHDVVDVHALSNGQEVITGDRENHIVCRWNLSTKQHQVMFDASGTLADFFGLLVSGTCIVLHSEHRIHVVTEDGDLVHSTMTDNIEKAAVGEQKVFFATRGDNISCLDLVTGNVQENVVTWEGADGDYADTYSMVVCGNMLVVIRADIVNEDHEQVNEPFRDGVYVFGLEDFSQKHFLGGNYHSLAKATADGRTLVAHRGDGTFEVLALDDGHLSTTVSFPCATTNGMARIVLLAHASHAYMCAFRLDGDKSNNRVEVYNILNGELVRAFRSTCATRASMNGSEVFFKTDIEDSYKSEVVAYSLQTY